MGFKNPISPRLKTKEKKNPWDFTAPTYDDRTSCYVDAGSHYGVGFKNPVGHTGPCKNEVDTLPYGRVDTPRVDEAPRQMLNPEMQD